ncbi:hypothetical protein [Enhygromyxa salina]|uniref:hypothetical protein n=1 Tax=Enhygromyxa salina TaxID=215803 RepID=UPI000D033201|nr:hypothetical protein [Enhygromyxa salina]
MPSLRLDLGPLFRLGHRPRPSFSLFLDLGLSIYSKPHDDSNLMFIFRPAIGYRFDSLIGRRHLGELGLELGLFQDVNDFTWTIGGSYRAALVAGSTPIPDGPTRRRWAFAMAPC